MRAGGPPDYLMDQAKKVNRIVLTVAVGAMSALAAFATILPQPSHQEWTAAGFFAAFGLLATVLGYPTSRTTHGTISFLPFLSVSLATPTIAALVAVLASVLVGEFLLRRQVVKLVFNAAQHTVAIALGIVAYLLMGGTTALEEAPRLLPFAGLAVTYFSVNKLAVSWVISATAGVRVLDHWVRSLKGSAVYDALSIPLVLIFVVAFVRLGAGWTAVLALPMLGVRQLYRQLFELEKINEELLQLMVASIEARDPYTSGHSRRVSRYARVIARVAGLSGRSVDRAVVAALLHDVGKIHEEFAAILRKPGSLSDAEFEVMKTHPAKSAQLVGKVSHFADIVPAIHAHHEAWDGAGYPRGLARQEIPIVARIIALADTIDAMTTSRPYRAALSTAQVRAEIAKESGRQFDPEICSKLLASAAWQELTQEMVLAIEEYPVRPAVDEPVGRTGEYPLVSRA